MSFAGVLGLTGFFHTDNKMRMARDSDSDTRADVFIAISAIDTCRKVAGNARAHRLDRLQRSFDSRTGSAAGGSNKAASTFSCRRRSFVMRRIGAIHGMRGLRRRDSRRH
jgi:hypothetical protein